MNKLLHSQTKVYHIDDKLKTILTIFSKKYMSLKRHTKFQMTFINDWLQHAEIKTVTQLVYQLHDIAYIL